MVPVLYSAPSLSSFAGESADTWQSMGTDQGSSPLMLKEKGWEVNWTIILETVK